MSQDSASLIASIWREVLNALDLLHDQPELALSLATGIGFYIGQKKFGPVQFGGVYGTLLTALLLA